MSLRSPRPLSYVAGQFIQLRLAGEWRAYTVAEMPDAYTIELVILLIDGGRASADLRRLKAGDGLEMLPPDGWFTYGQAAPSCFIGTSTGIIPCYAMVRAALEAGAGQPMTLLFGVRSQAQLFYVDKLDALAARYPNFKLVYALSRPQPGWQGYEGRVSDYIRTHMAEYRQHQFYLSAWHQTVESLEALLLRLGVARDKLYSEYYD